MPVLTCGGMRYQYHWQDTPLSNVPAENQANLEATGRRALDLGIHMLKRPAAMVLPNGSSARS